MKKQTLTASEKRQERLSKLIDACMEHFSEDEMLEAFSKSTRKEYVDKQEHEDMVSELVMAGYCVFKPEMSTQADKLKEYAETYIFPYYNQQQVSILF
jgi:hypothetical protein